MMGGTQKQFSLTRAASVHVVRQKPNSYQLILAGCALLLAVWRRASCGRCEKAVMATTGSQTSLRQSQSAVPTELIDLRRRVASLLLMTRDR
jgi:hypothetical protein